MHYDIAIYVLHKNVDQVQIPVSQTTFPATG